MKTTSKANIAFSIATAVMFLEMAWQPPVDSPQGLSLTVLLLAAFYFTFRYFNQIKREKK
jgi:hypothetical protein